MTRKTAGFGAVSLLTLLTVMVVAPAGAMLKGSGDVVTAAPVSSKVVSSPGERVDLSVNFEIARTWHLYAHGDTNFIGVDLIPAEAFPLMEFDAVYPEGHEGEFFGEKVYMIDGKGVIKASALVPEKLATGVHQLEFGLRVQACDDKTCLAPADLPIKIKLTVK